MLLPPTACAGTPAAGTCCCPPPTTQPSCCTTSASPASRCTASWATRRQPGALGKGLDLGKGLKGPGMGRGGAIAGLSVALQAFS